MLAFIDEQKRNYQVGAAIAMQMEGAQGAVMMLPDRYGGSGGGDLRVPHLREAREIEANTFTITSGTLFEHGHCLETNGDHYVLEIGYSSCTGNSANATGFC